MFYSLQPSNHLFQVIPVCLCLLPLIPQQLVGEESAVSPIHMVDQSFDLLNQGKTQKALESFQIILESDPSNLQAQLGEADFQ